MNFVTDFNLVVNFMRNLNSEVNFITNLFYIIDFMIHFTDDNFFDNFELADDFYDEF